MTDPNPHIPDETPPNPDTKPQQEETPPTNPQSPKTLPLADQDPQSQPQTLPDPNPTQPLQDEDTVMQDPVQKPDEPEPEPAAPAAVIATATAASSGAGRRGAPKKKKSEAKRTAQEKKSREKLQVLVETLKPIPFVPPKSLDFSSHQGLLQRLGLWEFVHLEYDPVVRSDLLAQLIASYVPASRCSYVNGCRIKVSRADLGRALKLPKKIGGSLVAEGKEEGGETVDFAESVGFIMDLVSNWMMLHDDMFIISSDAVAHLDVIKSGKLEKVDWAGLIWSMMEKELKSSKLTDCYYASHMQQMIKAQHQELLEEPEAAQEEEEVEDVGGRDDGEEAEVKDDEDEEEAAATATAKVTPGATATATATATVEDEVDESGDLKMGGVDEGGRDGELEEHNIELSLGQDNAERVEVGKDVVGGEQIMDFDQPKVEDAGFWLMEKNNVEEPYLRPCQTSDVKGVECGEAKGDEGERQEQEDEEEEEAEDDEHDGGFSLSPKCIPMEGMPSGPGGLVQAMSGVQMPFTSGIDLRDNPVGDFLSPRDDPQMISGSSLFGNGHKRELDLDNHYSHHALNGSNKRLRSESPWNSKPADFETCMDHIENWMGKARMMYAEKEQACDEAMANQQLLLNELQKRDEMVEQYHKAKMDESHKRQVEMYRLEKELFMMTSLVEGYRKALKETQKAFAEYRARCPQADEPLYKDVPGSGGLVLSVMELEKERLRKEEEERIKLRELMSDFERKLREFQSTWFNKLDDYDRSVESLANRLQAIEEQVKHLNEVKAKLKVAAPPECTPTVEEQKVEDQKVEEKNVEEQKVEEQKVEDQNVEEQNAL